MRDLLGKIVKFAGPAVGGLITGGPAGAGIAVLGQASAALAKKDGQKRQATATMLSSRLRKAGHHQASAPAAAVATPALVSLLLTRLGVDMPPDVIAGAIGLIVWASHAIGKRIEG